MLPSRYDNDDNIKTLGNWIDTQKKNYHKEDKIMKNSEIRELWKKFVNKYPQFFVSFKNEWLDIFSEVKKYVEIHKILPTQCHKNIHIRHLGNWIGNTKQTYKSKNGVMKDAEIKQIWETFVDENKVLFQNREDNWNDNLQQCEEYIRIYNKLPTQKNKDIDVKSLANFICNQKKNYKTKSYIMSDPLIRQQWEEFTSKYPHLF
jgi:hypothetical protein